MPGAHWMTNRVANPVLRRVLRTPLGRRFGRSLAVLRYPGTRTGTPHEPVCQYVRDDGHVWILVGHAETKTWWHNLRSPASVELWLAGHRMRASAVAVEEPEEPEECTRGLAAYSATVRRLAGLSPSDVVMVRADLTGA